MYSLFICCLLIFLSGIYFKCLYWEKQACLLSLTMGASAQVGITLPIAHVGVATTTVWSTCLHIYSYIYCLCYLIIYFWYDFTCDILLMWACLWFNLTILFLCLTHSHQNETVLKWNCSTWFIFLKIHLLIVFCMVWTYLPLLNIEQVSKKACTFWVA